MGAHQHLPLLLCPGWSCRQLVRALASLWLPCLRCAKLCILFKTHQLFVFVHVWLQMRIVSLCFECGTVESRPWLSVGIKGIYLGEDFTGSSEAETVKGKQKLVPSFIHLCTQGSKTPLLCSIPSTGFSCCPARTAAKVIHRDFSHMSICLLGIVLGLFSYLSNSIKSAHDCT